VAVAHFRLVRCNDPRDDPRVRSRTVIVRCTTVAAHCCRPTDSVGAARRVQKRASERFRGLDWATLAIVRFALSSTRDRVAAHSTARVTIGMAFRTLLSRLLSGGTLVAVSSSTLRGKARRS